jgi:hypothetical protein
VGITRSSSISVARGAARRSRGRRLLGPEPEREISDRKAAEREQHQRGQPRRSRDGGIADQPDRCIDAVGAGKAKRSAPTAGQSGHGRPAGEAERDSEQHCRDRGDEQSANDPARRLEPDHAKAGNRDHGQEEDRTDPEHQEQCVADIGAEAAEPVRGRTAGGGAQRRVGRAVAGECNGAAQADRHQQRAPCAHGETPHRLAQRIAPIRRQIPLRRARSHSRHVPPQRKLPR